MHSKKRKTDPFTLIALSTISLFIFVEAIYLITLTFFSNSVTPLLPEPEVVKQTQAPTPAKNPEPSDLQPAEPVG